MIVLRLVCKGKILLNIQMENVMCLYMSRQEEDTFEHTNVQLSFVNIVGQLIDQYVT